MAALTTIAIVGAGLAAAGSTANIISGASRAKKAQKALDKFKRQELKNITAGMRVSTLGAELQTQEANRRFATSVDALSSGGVRGLVGGLGRQEQIQQSGQQQISADLDRQQQQIEQMAAQDEANIRNIQEKRESSAIAGLGSEIAAGRNQVAQGVDGIAQAGMSAMTAGIGGMADVEAAKAGAAGISAAGNSALSAGMSAMSASYNPVTANLHQQKASSFQYPNSFVANNPYSTPKQNIAKEDFSGNPFTK
jgi:hypothetical protein